MIRIISHNIYLDETLLHSDYQVDLSNDKRKIHSYIHQNYLMMLLKSTSIYFQLPMKFQRLLNSLLKHRKSNVIHL